MDLDIVKQHLRVDHDSEDLLIEVYISAAKAFVAQHCNCEIVEEGIPGPEQMGYTTDVQQAVLLLVGHWYANRETVVVGAAPTAVPLAVTSLLWTRKRF
ncbi:head-tail connector protein [Schauerella aestuarii]|uniref:head-tail connector protein n=1 Tax=Schauerella aestuarii TaxID=2511204 RepID=UPI00192753D5|nr:head-tail connector protein [Achromobacter aestuarii]